MAVGGSSTPRSRPVATEYFYSLWNDPRILVLKTETGVNRDGIENLREEFRASERVGNSPPAA